MTIATDQAVQMLQAGWTVRYRESDEIEWRSPDGMSGSEWRSQSLDDPPMEAVKCAEHRGDIVDRPRVPNR